MTVTVSNIGPQSGSDISLAAGHQLQHEGKVVQTVTVRTDVRTTYSAPNSGIGTPITQLRLTITPRRSDSWIWLRWTTFYEMHHDTMFVVHQGGSLIGFNTYRGNVRFSGILTPLYDNDYSTTPQQSTINWFVRAGSTASRFYDLAVRSAGGGNWTYALNRSLNSAGTDGQEVGVSWGIAREISG
jgi:hypothetical protein